MAEYKTVLQKIRHHRGDFSEVFFDWMTIFNFQVFQHFEDQSRKTWEAGFRRYSARTILGYMRHETNVREQNSTWKLNNNLTADFARLYLLLHPEHKGFFELRGRKSA